jgi:hypothetical protein
VLGWFAEWWDGVMHDGMVGWMMGWSDAWWDGVLNDGMEWCMMGWWAVCLDGRLHDGMVFCKTWWFDGKVCGMPLWFAAWWNGVLNDRMVFSMMVKTYDKDGLVWSMDEWTIKTPYPKCRLYWCLIEFIDWRYSLMMVFSTPLVN